MTHYEQQLMAIYNTGTRLGLIQALNDMRTYLDTDQQELMDATDSAIAKLNAMTDMEYESLDLVPDFE
ncbi:MAG: transposon-transfer assisting family protein [Oscillospiraceae bacterium]|nr:transposon-transfer assisting family protein [Oscillospiraceae bacterium]